MDNKKIPNSTSKSVRASNIEGNKTKQQQLKNLKTSSQGEQGFFVSKNISQGARSAQEAKRLADERLKAINSKKNQIGTNKITANHKGVITNQVSTPATSNLVEKKKTLTAKTKVPIKTETRKPTSRPINSGVKKPISSVKNSQTNNQPTIQENVKRNENSNENIERNKKSLPNNFEDLFGAGVDFGNLPNFDSSQFDDFMGNFGNVSFPDFNAGTFNQMPQSYSNANFEPQVSNADLEKLKKAEQQAVDNLKNAPPIESHFEVPKVEADEISSVNEPVDNSDIKITPITPKFEADFNVEENSDVKTPDIEPIIEPELPKEQMEEQYAEPVKETVVPIVDLPEKDKEEDLNSEAQSSNIETDAEKEETSGEKSEDVESANEDVVKEEELTTEETQSEEVSSEETSDEGDNQENDDAVEDVKAEKVNEDKLNEEVAKIETDLKQSAEKKKEKSNNKFIIWLSNLFGKKNKNKLDPDNPQNKQENKRKKWLLLLLLLLLLFALFVWIFRDVLFPENPPEVTPGDVAIIITDSSGNVDSVDVYTYTPGDTIFFKPITFYSEKVVKDEEEDKNKWLKPYALRLKMNVICYDENGELVEFEYFEDGGEPLITGYKQGPDYDFTDYNGWLYYNEVIVPGEKGKALLSGVKLNTKFDNTWQGKEFGLRITYEIVYASSVMNIQEDWQEYDLPIEWAQNVVDITSRLS